MGLESQPKLGKSVEEREKEGIVRMNIAIVSLIKIESKWPFTGENSVTRPRPPTPIRAT